MQPHGSSVDEKLETFERGKFPGGGAAAGAPMPGAGCSCSHKALPWDALTVIKIFPELTSLIQPFFCSF